MSEAQSFHQQDYQRPELVCPAGTPAALRTAVDAGADAVYCGLQNETNARNFPGLNFTVAEVEQSLAYAHARKAKLLLAVNTFPPAGKFAMWREAIDGAAKLGVDAVIVADMGVADYAARTLSEPAAASVGAGRRLLARGDPLLLRAIRRQARGAAAHADRRRDRRAAQPDPVRDRSLHLRQYRHDGGGPLQPQQLRDRRVHQHGRRLLAGGRRALRRGCRAQSDHAARRIRDRLLRRRRKRRLSDHLQGPLSVRRAETTPITPSRSRSASICRRSCPT